MIAEYLNAVLEEGDDSDVGIAIGHIAKSIGMTKIAQETGLSRPGLYANECVLPSQPALCKTGFLSGISADFFIDKSRRHCNTLHYA